MARDLNKLTQLLKDTNSLPDAERLMKGALRINEQNLGKDLPDAAIVLNNQAQLLQATNRLSEAEPLMRRHLESSISSVSKPGRSIRICRRQ